MPTGYTADIKDGISFKEFLLNCSRAFGALVHLRDQPDAEIPDEIEPKTYHKEKLSELRSELKKVNQMEDEEILEEWEQIRDDAIGRAEKSISEAQELREKYEDMLEKVKDWEPPTEDHQNLKDFMIEQIEKSIDFDCSKTYSQKQLVNWKNKEKPSPYEYRQQRIESIQDDIKYHEEKWESEKKRAKDKTEWIRELKKSVDEL